MELHRIKEIQGDFNPQLYSELRKKAEPLINKLTYGIDHRRLGVSKDLVKSFFEDKFLFAFCKYYRVHPPNILLGHILTSLQLFKVRLIKKAYQKEAEFNQTLISMEDLSITLNIIPDKEEIGERDMMIGLVMDFFKKNLTEDAFLIFQIQLYPPIYILKRLSEPGQKIPTALIAEYLELSPIPKVISYINKLRAQIEEVTTHARNELKEAF